MYAGSAACSLSILDLLPVGLITTRDFPGDETHRTSSRDLFVVAFPGRSTKTECGVSFLCVFFLLVFLRIATGGCGRGDNMGRIYSQ